MPGESSNSILSLILIQLRVLVTPGLLPVTTTFLFTSLFIRVDFPTFGIPTINTLHFLIFWPLANLFSSSAF